MVADKWGQHSWGRWKSNELRRIGEKGTPWHFWEDKSRQTGVPQKSSSVEKQVMESAATPLALTPFAPFRRLAAPRQGVGAVQDDCTYIYIYIYTYIHICIDVYVCTYIYIYIYTHTYTCIYLSLSLSIYLCVCVYICIYTYVHTYLSIYLPISLSVHIYIYIYT